MDDNRVIIFDTTLRDGEQSPGISLNSAEKLEIAYQLARLGVDVIEAGFPIASNGDFDAVQAIAAVAHARSFVDDVEFSPMDATRADVEFTAEVLTAALEEGATTINIPDTVGYTMPHEYGAFLARLYELVPGLRDVVLSVHCHDDLGLAVANSFARLQAGAR